MGLTPIPCIRPQREYVEGLDGELIDVTSFSSGSGAGRPRFRFSASDITPRPDYWGNALSLSLTASLLGLVVVPLLWWIS